MSSAGPAALEVRVAFLPDRQHALLPEGDAVLLNVAPLLSAAQDDIHRSVEAALSAAVAMARDADRPVSVNTSYQLVNDQVLARLDGDLCDLATMARIKRALASFAVHSRNLALTHYLPPPYAGFDLTQQGAVMRYGNVELRVIESYLLDRDGLFAALDRLVDSPLSDDAMYRPGNNPHHLSADDAAWNLRALMTNAGYYAEATKSAARDSLVSWAERYLCALDHPLATYPAAYPFHFSIARSRWETSGRHPRYVRHPGPFEVYGALAGEDVLFVSPLAAQAGEQVQSGRLSRLYTNYRMPEFRFRAIPAWMSTWPNRPHGGWSQTFDSLCQAVGLAWAERPFSVFIASCGCYGLPLCDHVRRTFGAKVLYVGNIANAYFGVRQQATRGFMADTTNADMWVDGSLAHVPNVGRIDGGRYT